MNFLLLKNFLNNLAYYYYPKNLHESNPKYKETVEYKNYLLLHSKWDNLNSSLNYVMKEVYEQFSFENITVNGTSNNTPCYEIEVCIDNKKFDKKVVTIFISMFIPYYHIIQLEQDNNGRIKSDFIIPEKIEDAVSVTLKKIGYHKFPSDIINCKIPELNVLENFSYRTAFFTDCYRITTQKKEL